MRAPRLITVALVAIAAACSSPPPLLAAQPTTVAAAPPVVAPVAHLDSIRGAFAPTFDVQLQSYQMQRAIDSLVLEQKIVRGMRQSRERARIILAAHTPAPALSVASGYIVFAANREPAPSTEYSVPRLGTAAAGESHRTLNPFIYLGAVAGATLGAAKFDHDAGGWDRSQFHFTKDLYHTGGGALLEFASERATRSPLLSVLGSGAACVLFERWQGYPSHQDAEACGVGVASAFAFSRIFH